VGMPEYLISVLQCVAVCCSVLQCVAVCCSVLQRISNQNTPAQARTFCRAFRTEGIHSLVAVCVAVYVAVCVACCSVCFLCVAGCQLFAQNRSTAFCAKSTAKRNFLRKGNAFCCLACKGFTAFRAKITASRECLLLPCVLAAEQRKALQEGYQSLFIDCNTLQHTVAHRNTLQHTATHCNTLQHIESSMSLHEPCHTRLCNTLQHTATHCSTLQHTAAQCNTLQHTAAHCSTMQHTATHCNTMQHIESLMSHCSTLQHLVDLQPFVRKAQRKRNPFEKGMPSVALCVRDSQPFVRKAQRRGNPFPH